VWSARAADCNACLRISVPPNPAVLQLQHSSRIVSTCLVSAGGGREWLAVAVSTGPSQKDEYWSRVLWFDWAKKLQFDLTQTPLSDATHFSQITHVLSPEPKMLVVCGVSSAGTLSIAVWVAAKSHAAQNCGGFECSHRLKIDGARSSDPAQVFSKAIRLNAVCALPGNRLLSMQPNATRSSACLFSFFTFVFWFCCFSYQPPASSLHWPFGRWTRSTPLTRCSTCAGAPLPKRCLQWLRYRCGHSMHRRQRLVMSTLPLRVPRYHRIALQALRRQVKALM
jgi:hypothetical protein